VRLAEEAGAAAIAFHPRPAASRHAGAPDYELAAELASRLREGPGIPMIISGGLSTVARARRAYERSGADALMIARGALGYPWIFAELTGKRTTAPARDEIVGELLWLLDRAGDHFGPGRAARNLRKLYPWYLERLGIKGMRVNAFQRAASLEEVRELLDAAIAPALAPAVPPLAPAGAAL
jgi:tRNA-dihydrouridine synthase B